jgi:hypothetical protein
MCGNGVGLSGQNIVREESPLLISEKRSSFEQGRWIFFGGKQKEMKSEFP